MKKTVWLTLALAAVLFCGGYGVSAAERELVLQAEADTYITSNSGAAVNYGDETSLLVRAASYRQALVRFDLSGFPQDSGSILLRLYKTGGDADEIFAAVGKNSWEETAVTFQSYGGRKYTRADAVASAQVLKSSGWVYLDVTEQVRAADGGITFVIFDPQGAENNIKFAAREGGSHGPALVTEYAYAPQVSAVEVMPKYYGQTEVSIPLSGGVELACTARVKDQYGQDMDVQPVWSVRDACPGVTIQQDGTWALTDAAVPGTVTIAASCGGREGSCTYTLFAQTPVEKTFPGLLYSTEDLPLIRSRLEREPFAAQYQESYKRKDRYTMERLDHAVGINAWRTQSLQFHTPQNTAGVRICLTLSGRGNIRMDMLKVAGLTFENPGFESGLSGWRQEPGTGKISAAAESDTTFDAADNCGARFAVMESPDRDGEVAVWQETAAAPGRDYTGTIVLGQDGENTGGFYVTVQSLDRDGNVLSEDTAASFNRMTITKRTGLTTAHLANVYMGLGAGISQDKAAKSGYYYAEKAKKLLLYSLWEMRWGMDHLMTTGESLDDTYEAVHIGRAVKNLCYQYDQIRDVPPELGGITQAEENQIREHMYWIADTLMDTRYYDYTNETRRKHNYNADRSIGLLVFSVTFPYYHRAAEYYDHAVGELEWILEHSVGADGGWPESTRYHVAVLNSMGFAAKVMERAKGENWFENEKLRKMYDFMMRIQMPPDAAAAGIWKDRADYPPVGDADYSQMNGCIYAGIEGYAKTDPLFAAQLQYALDREGGGITDWLYLGPEDLTAVSPALETTLFPDMGYVAFRQDYGTAEEDYAFYSSAGKLIGSHQHNDRGSFILYSDRTPISLDAGMCDYGAEEGPWYEGPEAHNTVAFYQEDGTLYAGSENASVLDFYQSEAYDYVKSDIGGGGNQSYQRHFLFLKDGLDAYVIWDDIRGTRPSRFGIHALADRVSGAGDNSVTAACCNQKDFDVTFLEPADAAVSVRTTPLSNKTRYAQDYQQYITAQAPAGGDYLAVLYPRDRGADRLETVRAGENTYTVRNGEQICYILTNPGTQTVSAALPERVADPRCGQRYLAGEAILLEPGAMRICFPEPGGGPVSAGSVRLYSGGREISGAEALGGCRSVEVRAAAANQSGRTETAEVVCGVYGENGILIRAVRAAVPLAPGEEQNVSLAELELPEDGDYTLRVFIWSGGRPGGESFDLAVRK